MKLKRELVNRAASGGYTVTICPPGEAEGSHELNTRGHSYIQHEITVWPSDKHMPLFDGQGEGPRAILHGERAIWLWNQEMYVYIKERNSALNQALDEIESIFTGGYVPRPKEGRKTHKSQMKYDWNVAPQEADFGADKAWWVNWIKQAKGIKNPKKALDIEPKAE